MDLFVTCGREEKTRVNKKMTETLFWTPYSPPSTSTFCDPSIDYGSIEILDDKFNSGLQKE